MKDSVESKLGIFFAIAIIALLVILEFAGGYGFLERGYHLHALFKNVEELKTGDFVKMAGVQVGRIERIADPSNGVVNVTMNLRKGIDVRTDSKASIKFTGFMAQYFVSIDGGVSQIRAENDATLESVEQPDLSGLMIKLDNVASGVENLTRSFSGEKIDNLLGPFTDFLKNNQSNLTATIANIRTTSERIAAGQGTVGKLINEDTLYVTALNTVSNLEDTATNIQDLASQAREFVTNVNQTVTRINSGEGTIGKLIKDDTLYVETTGSMTNLHQILLKINHGQGTVGQLINDDSTLKNLKVSMQKLDKATESLEDTGPLSVLGTMVTTLF
jgi:phospholipid/cholesterol/gamma-HCH transport system substrate-binding protein